MVQDLWKKIDLYNIHVHNPEAAVLLSAVCDCGISDPTHLLTTYFLHSHPYFQLRFNKRVG